MAYYDGELLKQNLGKALNEFEELNVPLSEVAIKIGQAIKNTPTADVEEVVRCKDCKHWNCASNRTEHMECDIFCDCYGRGYATNPDDFCSYGERRDT